MGRCGRYTLSEVDSVVDIGVDHADDTMVGNRENLHC